MKELLQYLKSNGLVKYNKLSRSNLNKLDKVKILDTVENINDIIDNHKFSSPSSIYSFCSSISLAGGRKECGEFNCRKRRLDELARFAAFYSDNVSIKNHFEDYEHLQHEKLSELKYDFASDINLFLHIYPLLEKNILSYGKTNLCLDCFTKFLNLRFGGSANFKRALKLLTDEFIINMEGTLSKREYGVEFNIKVPYPLLEHGGKIIVQPNLPELIKKMPRLLSRFNSGKEVNLSKTVLKKLDLHYDFAYRVAENILFETTVNHIQGTTFLSEKSIYVKFLNSLSNSIDIEKRNQITFNHLQSVVPFVQDVSIKDLMTIRTRESENFLQFRSALSKSIGEVINYKNSFTERDAKTIYSDVIRPELAKLDKAVKESKRDLVKSIYRSIAGIVGSISFGIFSGGIPLEYASVVSALGSFKFGNDLIKKLMEAGNAETFINQKDLFFLWKVKGKTKPRIK